MLILTPILFTFMRWFWVGCKLWEIGNIVDEVSTLMIYMVLVVEKDAKEMIKEKERKLRENGAFLIDDEGAL